MTTEIAGENWKKADVVFEDKSFIFLHRDEGDHIFASLQRTASFYEQELLGVLRTLLRPGDWVVDAGANIGNHAIYFAGVCGCNVLAFEPNPVAAEILRKNVEINGLGDRIEIHEVALGSRAGSGDLVVPNEHNLGMVSVQEAEVGSGAIRIDLLSNYVGSRTIRLLKIDAEGMDYEVLAGAEEVLARDGCAVSIEAAKREEFLKIETLVERHGYVAAGCYNYTPTHVFLHERQDELAPFVRRMSRQISLDYIDRADIRDAFARGRRETSNQIGYLLSAFNQHSKDLPAALEKAQSSGTDAIRQHMDAGLLQVGKEIAGLVGKAGDITAGIDQAKNGLDSIVSVISKLEEKLDQRLSALEARSDRFSEALPVLEKKSDGLTQALADLSRLTATRMDDFSGALAQLDTRTASRMTEIGQALQQFDERGQTRHETALAKWKDDIGALFHCALLAAEADDLHEAAQAQERKLLRNDVRALKQQIAGEGTDTERTIGCDTDSIEVSDISPSVVHPAPVLLSARKRRAGVATTLDRLPLFEKAFSSIAPQVDELHVFLNGHASVPTFLTGIPSVSTYLSMDHDNLGDAGKFRGLPKLQDGYYLSFDDDILYPSDYVSRLVGAVDHYKCPTGVHGSIIRRDVASYYAFEGRYVFHFRDKLERDVPVDVLGTGTFCVDLEQNPLTAEFDYRNMADLWVAEYYRKRNVPLLCLARDYGWLKPLETESVSIWDANLKSRTIQKMIVEEKTRDLSQTLRPKVAGIPRIFIGIKTYNRKDYLQQSIDSIIRTLEPGYDYVLAVADDGSEDGTVEYLEHLRLPIDLTIIRNKRRYASGQFNELVRCGLDAGCEYFFLLDDDVVFRKSGWVSAYRNASLESGYDHLCHYNLPHHAQLAPRRGVDPVPVEFKSASYNLSAYTTVENCMGALMTLTPRVIDVVGFADETNFFIRGQWHVDFSARACRAGFNEYSRFFDLRGSNEYIELQNTIAQEYKSSIGWASDDFKRAAAPEEVARRKSIVKLRDRIYAPAISTLLQESDIFRPALHVNEAFERVLVLNLDRRPDRMTLMAERLKKADIEFERFAAIDGRDPAVKEAYDNYADRIQDFPESVIKSGIQFYQGGCSASEQARYIQARSKAPAIRSAGAWAYLLGYREILCRAFEEGWKSFLVLDDDCVFHRNFAVIFNEAFRELPSTWHILHLGMMQYDWDHTEPYSKHLYMPHGLIVGSHAVAYRREAIPGLLNWIDMMNLPYDVGPLQKESLLHRDRTFVVTPNLAIQDDLVSDINSSEVAPGEVHARDNKFRWNLDDYDY